MQILEREEATSLLTEAVLTTAEEGSFLSEVGARHRGFTDVRRVPYYRTIYPDPNGNSSSSVSRVFISFFASHQLHICKVLVPCRLRFMEMEKAVIPVLLISTLSMCVDSH